VRGSLSLYGCVTYPDRAQYRGERIAEPATQEAADMTETLDPLVRDLVEWVAKRPRTYAEVIEAWRTSCPRLTVWEDALDRGFVERRSMSGEGAQVVPTKAGLQFLEAATVLADRFPAKVPISGGIAPPGPIHHHGSGPKRSSQDGDRGVASAGIKVA